MGYSFNPVYMTAQPTPEIILVAVKAMLKNGAPVEAVLAVIADLEAIGEREQQYAMDRQIEQNQLAQMFAQKASG